MRVCSPFISFVTTGSLLLTVFVSFLFTFWGSLFAKQNLMYIIILLPSYIRFLRGIYFLLHSAFFLKSYIYFSVVYRDLSHCFFIAMLYSLLPNEFSNSPLLTVPKAIYICSINWALFFHSWQLIKFTSLIRNYRNEVI